MVFEKLPLKGRRAPTLALAALALLSAVSGYASGGYFVGYWAPVVLVLSALVLVASLAGMLRGVGWSSSPWAAAALGLFTAYVAWSFASMLWSPNAGDAWLGAAQTLLYVLVFGLAVALISLGGSRRWALLALVLGTAAVAAGTLAGLSAAGAVQTAFKDGRLIGTVGYYNGEAAFLLAPLWGAVYLAGSPRVDPLLRGLVLAGAVLCVELAVLTQSRGALVAIAVSLPVYFALSGQRLRGVVALIPFGVALLVSFSDLNAVYLTFIDEGEIAAAAVDRVVPIVWALSAAAGLYGLLWGAVDRWLEPSEGVVRGAGIAVALVVVVAFLAGTTTFVGQVGSPFAWAGQKWEAFKNDDRAGQEQSRYLSASGSGRYTFWEVAWEDFASHPLLGVGTHNYEATYYQLREQFGEPYGRQPHILPLEVLGERGVVGGALFFGFLGVCLAAGLGRGSTRLDGEGRALTGAAAAGVAYWFVHSTADWFWQLPAVTLPAILYLAVLVAPWRRVEREPPGWPWRAGVALGAVLVAALLVAPLYVADRYLARSYASDNPWVALEAVERAQSFNPVDPQLRQREAGLAMQIGDWPRAREAYEEAIRLNPEHYAPYTLLARLHEQLGETEEALAAYREAQARNPLDPELEEAATRLEAEVAGTS